MAKLTWIAVSVLAGFALSCSAKEGINAPTGPSGGGSNGDGLGGDSGQSLGQGGDVSLTMGGNANAGGTAGSTGTAVECTEGEDCTCPTVSVAVLGKPGQYGDKDTTAFMTWLNSSSAGTAKVDNHPDRAPLSAEFLAPYNVIILLGLGDDSDKGPFWTFDDAEVLAMQTWIEAGGGLITLSGASGSLDEVKPTNQLIEFTGISYNTDGFVPDCSLVDDNGNTMCWCTGGPQPVAPTDFRTDDPVVADLAKGITTGVGIHVGRSINAPADANVAAAVVANGSMEYNALVGKLAGSGRVLVFSDEWITYTSQWNSAATSDTDTCAGFMPADVFQTAQFWYNMVHWVQPAATCFKIVDEQQEVVLW